MTAATVRRYPVAATFTVNDPGGNPHEIAIHRDLDHHVLVDGIELPHPYHTLEGASRGGEEYINLEWNEAEKKRQREALK